MRLTHYLGALGAVLFVGGLTLLGFSLRGFGIVLDWLLPPLLWLIGGVLIVGWAMNCGLRQAEFRVLSRNRADAKPEPHIKRAA